jgi:6-phospho-3-hexuloisomerase
MSELKYMDLSLVEIQKNIDGCNLVIENQKDAINEFREIILTASNKRTSKLRETTIFVAGAGRSGFVAKSFAMRLMHLGFYVYVFGETIAPPVSDGDIIIIVSKSGKSNSITQIVENSKMDNVKFLSVCGSEECDLVEISEAKIIIDTLPQETISIKGQKEPLELILMGTAFETCALILLDTLVVELMENLKLREANLADYHDVLSSSL